MNATSRIFASLGASLCVYVDARVSGRGLCHLPAYRTSRLTSFVNNEKTLVSSRSFNLPRGPRLDAMADRSLGGPPCVDAVGPK